MANWCYNIVQFHAEAAVMEQLENLFYQMATKETSTGHGQLPDFIKEEADWLFNIRWKNKPSIMKQGGHPISPPSKR